MNEHITYMHPQQHKHVDIFIFTLFWNFYCNMLIVFTLMVLYLFFLAMPEHANGGHT